MSLANLAAGALAKLRRPKFKYSPLKAPTSIRLVKLSPPTLDHLVHCDLIDVDLSTSPSYEALSYTWAIDGDFTEPRNDAAKRTIICNNASLDIFQNLYNALIHLQKLGWTSEPLWFDAICINQTDNVEKSTQVNMMGDIFRNASRVIVWLGRSTMAAEAAISRLKYDLEQNPQSNRKLSVKSVSELNHYLALVASWVWLLSRGWFGRVWTLQEAVLARKTVYLIGTHEVPMRHVSIEVRSHGARCAQSSHSTELRIIGLIYLQTAHEMLEAGGVLSFEAALAEARNRRSSDSRDKLFGVLAMRQNNVSGDMAHLVADYQKSVHEVFYEAATALLRSETTGIFLLSLVGQIRHESSLENRFRSGYISSFKSEEGFVRDLPSWVPDLTAPARPVPLRDLVSQVEFSAASSLRASFHISSDNRKLLKVQAAVLDTISVTGDYLTPRLFSIIWRLLRIPLKLLESCVDVYLPTGESIISAFWRTLMAGLTHNKDGVELTDSHFVEWFGTFAMKGHAASESKMCRLIMEERSEYDDLDLADEPEDRDINAPRGIRAHYKEGDKEDHYKIHTVRKFVAAFDSPAYGFRKAIEQAGKLRDSLTVLQHLELELEFSYDEMFEALYNDRRIFLSEKGYMGTAPWTVMEGDVIFLVAGTYVPYVFRRSKKIEGAWELVGEAYCHGFMFGEGLKLEGLKFDMIDVC